MESSNRMKRLPYYLFTIIDDLKKKAREIGMDIIDLGMGNPDKPTPIGVFRSVNVNLYEEQMKKQIENHKANSGKGDLKTLLTSGESWSVN